MPESSGTPLGEIAVVSTAPYAVAAVAVGSIAGSGPVGEAQAVRKNATATRMNGTESMIYSLGEQSNEKVEYIKI